MISGPTVRGADRSASPLGKFAFFQRAPRYLRAHPVLCLLLLSPGIPEYLSGSSAVSAIITNPLMFCIQLIANLGLYGPGVLLIREAKIRWRKGWASVLLMGAAYGILEEGIALSTLFNSQASPVGELGYYGHYLGVNWIWLSGILSVHMIFSISLPILLLGLALPETKTKEFLNSKRKIAGPFAILGVDVFALFLVVLQGEHFWMGWTIFLMSFAVIGILLALSYYAPTNVLIPKHETATIGRKAAGVSGAAFYSSILIVEFGGIASGLPPLLVFPAVIFVQSLFLFFVMRNIGQVGNERNLIAFAIGLIMPIALFGLLSQITLPVIYLVDFTMILFFRKLWSKYSDIKPNLAIIVSDTSNPTLQRT